MAQTTLLLILGMVLGSSVAQNCWKTGCQPNDWATKGCAQYGRDEKGKEACTDGRGAAGFKYNCCEKKAGGGGSTGGSTGGGTGSGGSTGGDFATFDQFSKAITSNGYPAPSKEQFTNFNRYARANGKITTQQEAAMALAQILHESDGLRAKREYACQATQCPTQYRTPGCDAPGQYYFGRGYIQLSWCYNYRDASTAIFGDSRLITDADQVAKNDAVAWQTAFWFWGSRVHNAAGVQQGQLGAATKAINGGLECGGKTHPGPAKRFKLYGNVRAAFGLPGAGDSSGC